MNGKAKAIPPGRGMASADLESGNCTSGSSIAQCAPDFNPPQARFYPAELQQLRQWVCYKLVPQPDGKTDKIPINPHTGANASTTDAETWGMFEDARAYFEDHPDEVDGIGPVFTPTDPYFGVDPDDCIDEAGTLKPDVQRIVDRLNTYTAYSQSGHGLHIIGKGELPPGGREKKGFGGLYDSGRFFALTGKPYPGTPRTIAERQAEIEAIHAELFPPKKKETSTPPPSVDDRALLDTMFTAANGASIRRLWEGDTSEYPSSSEADLALCNHLAFYCNGDTARMDAFFRQSGLYREKWDREDYRTKTLEEAQAQHHSYDPKYGKPATKQAKEDAERRQNGQHAPAQGATLPYSDYTNALAFVREHGTDFRYCYPWKTWLTWRGTHWERDETGQTMRCAKQTIKRLARRAEALDDTPALRALLAHVKTSLSTAKLKAMLESAQSEDGIPARPEEWDTNAWLLNCANGTLDLRTGTIKDHCRTDYLTKCLAVSYDPHALCPTWDAFLWRIMGGTVEPDSPDDSAGTLENRQYADERARDLIDFLQRAVGYALTGDTREECLFIAYGTGQNGKSKFLGALQDLLGDYAQATHSKTFMVCDRIDGIPNDLARLRGARFVSAIELGKDRRLNEELVKRVTGGDPITARFLHGEFFDFLPQFKLFMATNYLPRITSIDKAMWRRIFQVPFTVTIPDEEKDDRLGEKLRAELPGILAWAVRGCLEWQKNGLRPPGAVREATAAYKSSMDTIGRFVEECCIVNLSNSSLRAKASSLYDEYKKWCEANGEHFETQTVFGKYLDNQGFEKDKKGIVWRVYIGFP